MVGFLVGVAWEASAELFVFACFPGGIDLTSERPVGWPGMYSAAGRTPSCPHQMHWDDSEDVYQCIYGCGEVDEKPPESKLRGGLA